MDTTASPIRNVNVTRYITPLREGGSLPAIVEACDGFMYVLKFRGAGQGIKALIAELIGGETARALGLKVPEIVLANIDSAFGRTEPDEEIQDLLKASTGLNLGLHYLSGSITFDPAVTAIPSALASKIVWMDAFLVNMDRTVRNTNMLWWQKELWLIDHGACLYFHHNPATWKEKIDTPFALIKDHVLLPYAGELEAADKSSRALLDNEKIKAIVDLVPEEWLTIDNPFSTTEEHREMYITFLQQRIAQSPVFVNEALHARQRFI